MASPWGSYVPSLVLIPSGSIIYATSNPTITMVLRLPHQVVYNVCEGPGHGGGEQGYAHEHQV